MTRNLFLLFVAVLFVLAVSDAFRFARKDWKTVKTRRELILSIGLMAALINFFAFLLIDVLMAETH